MSRKKSLSKDLSDKERLLTVARMLLLRLEEALSTMDSQKEEEIRLFQQKHEWLFGTKQSLTSSLVLLYELMNKLQMTEAEETGSSSEIVMSEADATIVRAFVERMRTSL